MQYSHDMNNCPVCGVKLTIHQRIRNAVCDNPACRQEKARRYVAERRDVEQALLETAKQQCKELKPKLDLGVVDTEQVLVTVIPANTAPLAALPHTRFEAFMRNLTQAVNAAEDKDEDKEFFQETTDFAVPAAENEPGDGGPSADAAPYFAQACGLCKGHCCFTGGDEGYIDAEVIGRYWRKNPQAQAQDVIDTFAGWLPDKSYEGSCVYHGEAGCNLPREARSSYCTSYLCSGLWELNNTLNEHENPLVFAAAAQNDKITRSAFFDQHGLRSADTDDKTE